MVDRAGLENRRAARSRGFESHPLRHIPCKGSENVGGGMRTKFKRREAQLRRRAPLNTNMPIFTFVDAASEKF